ncbi:MAG: type 4a pilus biogenesis protein PilO [Candidatus Berkelbacteria bacterium]|nr:type 4a pilus biogenesis protein PilO [Candidatus Berkelbacteria bacterium]
MNYKQHSTEIIAVSLVVLASIFFLGYQYVLKDLRSMSTEVSAKKQELTQKQKKLEDLQNTKSKLASLKKDLEIMQKALPKEEDIPGILVSTEALVGNSGLGLVSFSPPVAKQATSSLSNTSSSSSGTSSEKESSSLSTVYAADPASISPAVTSQVGVASVSYGLTLQGVYPAFLVFLENVEKNLRPTSISTINITTGGPDKPLSYTMNIVSYYQK